MKPYNNEPAIISLTSWKQRIHTVGLTIFNLLKNCPQCHICLVLSREEFPKTYEDLPRDLNLLCMSNQIEILWVEKNVRSFKKILYTIAKYPAVPVISADDDCLYKCNYADILLHEFYQRPHTVISCIPNHVFNKLYLPNGCSSLYPPNVFGDVGLACLNDTIVNTNNDDLYLGYLLNKLGVPIYYIGSWLAEFHDEILPMGDCGMYSRGESVLDIIDSAIDKRLLNTLIETH